ncbi:hypothetical protein H4R33_001687 [Dimargaris cristalligena]|uniref:TRP C-terminal domain-containing protein n=1 Tax=Dimargaris cristalligena TaxID=215637 RepID=A0A4P9ZMH0_9FUNG|nr:hypothetical protein H4R33_001687 [Dimargaris cristalligena]RKP34574.1 hypothetical protein BJ085DRAFT_35699 [Dimargaris cristalligena]|eukprot:RKP34574.1 hypothetical protein BJ085DRAFT_35699 [Dimargaris cristalligena]
MLNYIWTNPMAWAQLVLGILIINTLPTVQARVDILTPIPNIPTQQPSIDFYYDQVSPYNSTGPLVQIDIGPNCVIDASAVPELDNDDWLTLVAPNTKTTNIGTTIFFERLQFIAAGCYSFTQLMKQIPAIRPTLTAKGYPQLKVSLFSCVLFANTTFGGLDYEVIDDYYYHRPTGVEIAQIGLDTGIMYSQTLLHMRNQTALTNQTYTPLVVQVTQEPGAWNDLLLSQSFRSYTIFYHISFAPPIIYAIYEFFRLLIKSKCRFQPRFFIFLAAIFCLAVSAILPPTAALSRVQNAFRYISFMVGYNSLYIVLLMWIRIMQKIMRRSYVRYLIWLIYFVIFTSLTANFILVIWSITQISVLVYIGWGIHSYVSSVAIYVMAVVLVPYGFLIVRNLKHMNIPNDTREALITLSSLSYVGFVGGLMVSVAMMLIITSITQYISVCLIRSALFHVSALLMFTSVFWILRVRDSSPLRRRHLNLVSGSESNDDGACDNGHINYTPKISQPIGYRHEETSIRHGLQDLWNNSMRGLKNPSTNPDWDPQMPKPMAVPWYTRWLGIKDKRSQPTPPPGLPLHYSTYLRPREDPHEPPTPAMYTSTTSTSSTSHLNSTSKSPSLSKADYYFPGGYYPNSGYSAVQRSHRHSSSASTISAEPRTKYLNGDDDYPNPLNYFAAGQMESPSTASTTPQLSKSSTANNSAKPSSTNINGQYHDDQPGADSK